MDVMTFRERHSEFLTKEDKLYSKQTLLKTLVKRMCQWYNAFS
jgi:hypothetical protein